MALRICWGIRARGSRRLKCGEPVDDPRVVKETMKLINEFMNRVERHKAPLLGDSTTPFDGSIRALSDWLSRIAVGNGDDVIAMLRSAEREVGKEMLKLLNQAREEWLRTYKPELEELIEKLRKEEATIIISGEPLNKDKSFMVHLYAEHITININKIAKSEGIIIKIILTGLKGTNIVVPKLFSNTKLRAAQDGVLITDGTIDEDGYPAMGTNQLWQTIIFPLIWPGNTRVAIQGLSLNNDLKIIWYLRAVDHKNEFNSKIDSAKQVLEFNDEEFLLFLLFAVLCDGDINIKHKRIRLFVSKIKYGLWSDIIKKLMSLKFKEDDINNENVKTYTIKASRAIALTRKMLDDLAIKAMIEDLAQLPDAKKLRQLIELANMNIKPLGRFLIDVIYGIKISVEVNNKGYVILRVGRKRLEDAETIQKRLKGAGYDAKLRKRYNRFEIHITQREIKRHPELVSRVCEVLRRMLEEAVNESKERRVKVIVKAIRKLSCQ